jgi:peptidyl-prolyl cis-trans isomerase C
MIRHSATRLCLLIALAAAVTLVTGAFYARAQGNDPVVARVDGTEIRASDLAIAEEDIGQQIPPNTPPQGRRDYLITYIADMVLLAKAGEEKKLADTEDFKRRIAYSRSKLLMEAYLGAEGKAALTDEALRKVYEEATKEMKGEIEVRARHILVETEQEAKDVLVELGKGRDFAELAKERSKDPGAAEGGDLGYFTKDQMVAEFAEVAFKLEKGQLSAPVQTQFGWHIIKVEDKRAREIPSFESVRDQVIAYVMRKTQADVIARVRAKAKIERLEAKQD